MVNNLSHAIDFAIDKKLNQDVAVKGHIKNLVKYSKYNSLKRYQFARNFENFDLNNSGIMRTQRDLYDNQVYSFFKVKKTQCKFNLIRLFEPGELLNSVMSS